VTDYGAILGSVEAPDTGGRMDHVVLGFEDADSYFRYGGSFGEIIGRCANRIAGERFTIGSFAYETSTNDRRATLHRGEEGFWWRFSSVTSTAEGRSCRCRALMEIRGFPDNRPSTRPILSAGQTSNYLSSPRPQFSEKVEATFR
jgi:aldose 1-epimerase